MGEGGDKGRVEEGESTFVMVRVAMSLLNSELTRSGNDERMGSVLEFYAKSIVNGRLSEYPGRAVGSQQRRTPDSSCCLLWRT